MEKFFTTAPHPVLPTLVTFSCFYRISWSKVTCERNNLFWFIVPEESSIIVGEAKQDAKRSQLEEEQGYKMSSTLVNDIFPLARLHCVPKSGTKYTKMWAHKENFSFKKPHHY